MGYAPVKRINNDISRPLNILIMSALNMVDTRRYFYSNYYYNYADRNYISTSNTTRTYTIPINGYYTIRAYQNTYGSYGKIIGKFTKGEVLTINFGNNSVISSKRDTNTFYMDFGYNVIINGTSDDFVYALGIGGSDRKDGGNVNVRCNNGIAVGGGGGCVFSSVSGYQSYVLHGKNGGTARAWGINVRALGGGGGAGYDDIYYNNSYHDLGGAGGAGYINDVYTSSGGRGNETRGGSGGCGGAGYVRQYSQSYDPDISTGIGSGTYCSGGYMVGGSAKAPPTASSYFGSLGASKNGYFEGGIGNFLTVSEYSSSTTYLPDSNGFNGGNGGFYGGRGGAPGNTKNNSLHYGNGGSSIYGFGAYGYYGGNGQLQGGSGDYKGGSGLNPGSGNSSTGTAIRHKPIIHTLPLWGSCGYTVVIIEYGVSNANY